MKRPLALFAVVVVSAVLFTIAGTANAATVEPRTTFTDSLGPVSTPIRATARALAAPELTGTLAFNVALRMRNFPALQARIARGELVSQADLERDYLPLPADYDTLTKWLASEGFTITRRDPSRLAVFARGTVAQVQRSLQVSMSRVTVQGINYPAAVSNPSLPASIAKGVLGINGLQPYHRHHRHTALAPQTSNAAPYKIDEIRTAYNAANTGYTGAGETIAILIDATPLTTDLTQFWSDNNVPQSLGNITTINVNNETITNRELEETLDVEWTSGIASGAKIRVYATGTLNDSDLDNGLAQIVADLGTDATIHELSISLGEGERDESINELVTDSQYFATMASKGVSVFVSSGDQGSTPDDKNPPGTTGPLQVEFYSSDPDVTGVGGTSLRLDPSTGVRTAETAWNGSGGGLSAYFTRPGWQTGTGVPAGGFRAVPDVCLPADPNTGCYLVYSGGATQVGGTSWSAPTWAGFCAVINEARVKSGKGPLGLLNPYLYPLLGTANFHDITSGSNAVGTNANGSYSAGAGYDPVTGIGSPDVGTLLNTLVSSTGPSPTITGFSPGRGTVGSTVTITGTNFTAVSGVNFNGGNATAYTVTSPTQIVATVPADAVNGPIRVFTANGAAYSPRKFGVVPASPLVISQVYANGNAVGATYTNDFVELFNPTSTDISLNGYSLQYGAAPGGPTGGFIFPSASTVQAKHYFLIAATGGTAGTSALPSADLNVNGMDVPNTAGEVTLVKSTYLIADDASSGVTDFVGYGPNARDYEGTGPAPAVSNTTAIFRANGGLVDTDDNSADFTAGTPNPRNSVSTVNLPDLTITKTHTGSFTQADSADKYTITVSNGGMAATAGTVSVVDALPTGLMAVSLAGNGWTTNLATLTCTRGDALAAGSSYPAITVTVSVAANAPSSVTNSATVSGGSESNTANDTASDPTTITPLAGIQAWREKYFNTTANTGAAADSTITAGDGLTNLLKYAFNLDPTVPAVAPLTESTSTGHLQLTVTKNPNATDLTYTVQVNGDLTNASGWTSQGTTIDQNTSTVLQVHDNALVSAGVPRFIRVQVSGP